MSILLQIPVYLSRPTWEIRGESIPGPKLTPGSHNLWNHFCVSLAKMGWGDNNRSGSRSSVMCTHVKAEQVMDVREDTFTVRTYECQADGKVKINSLMQHLQEVASAHAEQLGFGYDWMNGINGYWVLSNLRVEITQLPKLNDEVTIETWPSGYTWAIATREFIGKDQSGRELFKASSEWMVLNKQNNRLKNLFRLDLGLPKTGQRALPG